MDSTRAGSNFATRAPSLARARSRSTRWSQRWLAATARPDAAHRQLRDEMTPEPSAPEGRLPRMDVVPEVGEILPGRLRRVATRPRRIDRRIDHLHVRDVARTIRKDRPRGDADHQLRAHGPGQQRIVAADRR